MNRPAQYKKYLKLFTQKMKKDGSTKAAISSFEYYFKETYQKIASGTENIAGLISEKDIEPIFYDEFENVDSLSQNYTEQGRKVLKNTVHIVLNGGLGTSMGMTGPKSLIKVKNNRSFIDIILNRCKILGIKAVLMNSFYTDADVKKEVKKLGYSPIMFTQNRFPRILRNTLLPASFPDEPDLEWNPPGHGDIYTALNTSGTLDKLLSMGIKYAFISNSDNLGAYIDESILGYFAAKKFPFMMEATKRTPFDNKGGHLARRKSDARLILRESAQCHKKDQKYFQDINRYTLFNTNNLWINLEDLKKTLSNELFIKLPLILNRCNIVQSDLKKNGVFQIETAMGTAISFFDRAAVLTVPRKRFMPVKRCSDLFKIMSDRYLLLENCFLIKNPDIKFFNIKIDLDDDFYGKIDDFEKRVPYGPPSLVECSRLKVKGDVFFEHGVKIKGSAVISGAGVVKKGAVIENFDGKI